MDTKKRGGKHIACHLFVVMSFFISMSQLHHSGLSGCWHSRLLLRLVADEALSGQEHTCYRSSVLQSHTLYLGVHYDSALATGVEDNLTQRLLDSAAYDVDTSLLIGIVALEILELFLSTDVSSTATDNNTFLAGCTSSAECIVATILLFLHLHLGVSTDIEHCNTTAELAQTLLQLLFVV